MFLHGFLTVPLAERVMFLTPKSSRAIRSWSTRSSLCVDQSPLLIASFVALRRLEPLVCLASLRCSRLLGWRSRLVSSFTRLVSQAPPRVASEL